MSGFIVNHNLQSALDFIDKVVKDGKDLSIFLNALIEYLRNLLLAKVSLKTFNTLTDISDQSKESILKISAVISLSQILKIIDLLIEAKELSHRLNTVRIPLELALVKFILPQESDYGKPGAKSADISANAKPAAVKEIKVESKSTDINVGLEGDFDLDDDGDSAKKEPLPDAESQSAPNEDGLLFNEVKAKWQEIITAAQKVRAAISSHLSFSEPVSSSANIIKIGFSNKDYFHKEIVETPKNVKFIEDVISKIVNKKVGLKFILSDKIASKTVKITPLGSAPMKNEGGASGQPNEFINELMDTFGGQFHTDDE
jgi:DNA polymerase-3 subunit gamma/tau